MSMPRITMDRVPVYKPLKPRLLSMPQKGTYILLRIDPVGTLEALDDPHVNQSASKIKTQSYVGFVEEVLNDLDPQFPYRAIRVRLLHRGLPKANEAEGIEPHMCFAVRPATDHPLSTRPLIPSKPLPWDDCYHHTSFPSAVLRVRYSRAFDHESWWLKPSELRWFDSVQRRDAAKRETLRTEYREGHPGALLEGKQVPRAPSPDEDPTAQDDGLDTDVPGAVAPPGGDVQQDDTAEELIALFAMMDHASKANRPHDTMTLATVSYDIDSVSTWGAPEDFFKEQTQLLNIEQEFKARLVAKAEQANDAYGSTAEQIKQMYSRRTEKETETYTEGPVLVNPGGDGATCPQDSQETSHAVSEKEPDKMQPDEIFNYTSFTQWKESPSRKKRPSIRPFKFISFVRKKAKHVVATAQYFIVRLQGKHLAS